MRELKAIKTAGGKAVADLIFIGDEINPQKLDKAIAGKIICGGRVGQTALIKAHALDAAGMVVTDLTEEDFNDVYCGKKWEIGNETCDYDLPLMVIDKTDLPSVRENQGKKAILDPAEKKLTIKD